MTQTDFNIPNCFWQCFNEKSNSFSELESFFFKIIFAFGILNFGHAQRRRLRRVL